MYLLRIRHYRSILYASISSRARLQRAMSTESTDHIHRTASNTREEAITKATVKEICDLSPTVKKLTLHVENPKFSFKAGQWVDFSIPTIKTVGGYSICSCPKILQQKQELDLAVKFSKHPPALWVHTECRVGSEVQMRVGGDFYFDPREGQGHEELLLVAGGIGINPLLSVMLHAADLQTNTDGPHSQVCLLYSAKTQEELVFQREIKLLTEQHANMQAEFLLTQSDANSHRISKETISRHVGRFADKNRLQSYICGPSPMIDAMQEYLMSEGLSRQQVHFEKWW